MKVYISGPMTGLPDLNRPAFTDAEQVLKLCGYEVLNPANVTAPPDATWEQYMRLDIPMLMHADAIYLLGGWERSRGARIEFNLACELKMRVILAPGAIFQSAREWVSCAKS